MILWLNPVSGVSGDMLLAALIDAGAQLDGIRDAVASTGLTGWRLDVEGGRISGIPAAIARVSVDDPAPVRRAGELRRMIERARPEPVARLAGRALTCLVEVEARLHGEPVERVHLHELGGHDTVVDLVGVAAALHLLGVEDVASAPLPLGTGLVESRHGTLPSPAPATLALLEGMTVVGAPLVGETVTPTGAALLRAMHCRFDPPPPGILRATGYGMGSRSISDRPNLLVAMLCDPSPAEGDEGRMTVIETNVDDVTGEQLGYTIQTLLNLGAADAWVQTAVGKKGRPVYIVTVLTHDGLANVLEDRLLAETGSLGARRTRVNRTVLSRHVDAIDLGNRTVRIKHGPYGHKPEFDDVAAIAEADGTPWRVVAQRALALYARRNDQSRAHNTGAESTSSHD